LTASEGAGHSSSSRGLLRLFVAVDLPHAVKEDIAAWQRRAIEPHEELRVNRALHLTLSFLGDTPSERVAALTGALSTVAWTPFDVRVEAAPLYLPVRGTKRVVALSLADSRGELAALRSRVVEALSAHVAAEPSKRPWRPHVTVARFRRPGQPISLQNVNILGFGVDSMVLYSSLLENAGAVHTPIAVFPAF
jgi:RNA 2',3'-cyclic 3'-phosphodiesterase